MRRIFTLLTASACLLAIGQKGFSQTLTPLTSTQCNSVNFNGAESADFNDGSTTNMSGFSGLGWSKAIQGSNEYLTVPNGVGGAAYNLVTPTYTTFSPNLNLKFTIGGNSKVNSYMISVETASGTNFLGVVSDIPSGVSGVQCLSITGFNVINEPFRFVISFSLADGPSGSGVLTFDDYFLTQVIAAITLPVHFSGFNAKALSSSIALNWNVGMEESGSSYVIERSADGRNFSSIGLVAANGQTSYSFADTKPLSVGYYRIKSVDATGKVIYSSIITLKGGLSAVLLKAFLSNPTTLIVQHDAAQIGSHISISSADGRLIKSLAPATGSQQTSIDLSTAKPGLYLVRFDNGTGAGGAIKVMKQQ